MDGRHFRHTPLSTTMSDAVDTTIPSSQRTEGRDYPRQLPHANQPHIAVRPLSVPACVDPTASLLAVQALIANALGQYPVPVPEAIHQVEPVPHAALQGNTPDSLTLLQMRLPAIDSALFHTILETRLQPGDIMKLSSSFHIYGTSHRQELVTLGPYIIPTMEKDTGAADYRGMGALLQPLFIYFHALVRFAPDGIKIGLAAALFEYIDLILELNRYYFFESVKIVHFTFHRKRMTLGVYDPEG